MSKFASMPGKVPWDPPADHHRRKERLNA